MPVTPARQARDVERNEQKRAEGRMQNEAKYTEFRVNCDEGDAGACTSLGEWWAMMRKDFKQAMELYSPMCLERKYPQACLNLGNLLGELTSDAAA
jgi:TPR repeat protein